jgi:hypothetical protein
MALRQWLSWGAGPKSSLLFTTWSCRHQQASSGRSGEGRYASSKVFVHGRYSRSAVACNATLDVGTHLLQKPFSIELLAAKVRQMLDS